MITEVEYWQEHTVMNPQPLIKGISGEGSWGGVGRHMSMESDTDDKYTCEAVFQIHGHSLAFEEAIRGSLLDAACFDRDTQVSFSHQD